MASISHRDLSEYKIMALEQQNNFLIDKNTSLNHEMANLILENQRLKDELKHMTFLEFIKIKLKGIK
jgi:hypothetical protein